MKNKKIKLASLALALTLSAAVISPAFADTANETEVNAYEYKTDMAVNQTPNELKAEARALKTTLLDVGPFAPYLKIIDKIIDILNSFDIKSSGPRLTLASDSLETILIATRDLTNKTEAVHRKIGFAVTRAVIVLADPFTSTDNIIKTSENLKKVVNEAFESKDITENDIATVYKKEKLNKLLNEAKAYRLHNLGRIEYKDLKNELNKAINKAVKTKLGLRVTVGEIDKAYQELESILNEVKEKSIPIAAEIEAKEKLVKAKDLANKDLLKARNDQKVKINKVKEANSKAKLASKKEVDKIFNKAKADIKASTNLEEVENIKNIALQEISLVLPAIEAPKDVIKEEVSPVKEDESNKEIQKEDLESDDKGEVLEEENKEEAPDKKEANEKLEEKEENSGAQINPEEESVENLE